MSDTPSAKKPSRPRAPGIELLSDAEVTALRNEAKAKVGEDAKKAARKAALEAMIREENSRIDPNEELVEYTIDLPGYASEIRVDGVQYIQGETYKFTRRQLASMQEIVQNSWKHEKAVGGANANEYRRPRNVAISPNTAIAYSGHFAR